ncbi:MAG TPA: hypothetical protein VHJ39_04665 [Solirubrobacteraceae bacterium]|jgi:hypothetical protein|nr:hypothetical protein [Solirubrobacteraceae bacterium]
MPTNRILAALLAAVALVVGPSTALAKPIDNTPSSGAEAAAADRAEIKRALAMEQQYGAHGSATDAPRRPLTREQVLTGTNQALPAYTGPAQSPTTRVVEVSDSGFDFGAAAIGAGIGLILAMTGAVAVVRHRDRHTVAIP